MPEVLRRIAAKKLRLCSDRGESTVLVDALSIFFIIAEVKVSNIGRVDRPVF